VSRVLFPPAVVFKGHGFHNTDYGTRRRPVEAPASSRKGRGGKGAAHPRAGRGPAKAARRARASAR
jgi:predicted nucleic acid-binding Zn ribbon protein